MTSSCIHSLVPGEWGSSSKSVISEHILWFALMNIFCEIVLTWMPQTNFEVMSTLIHVMVCYGQTPSHWLSQCWPWSMSIYWYHSYLKLDILLIWMIRTPQIGANMYTFTIITTYHNGCANFVSFYCQNCLILLLRNCYGQFTDVHHYCALFELSFSR